jgi:predicted ester cyclase
MPDTDPALIARRFVAEVLDGGRLAAAGELVSPEVVVHVPAREEPLRGLDALTAYIAGFRAALPDVAFELEDLLADGDRVAVRLTVSGTHAGELLGVAPTGRRVRVPEVLILRVEDGLIVEDWVQADLLGLLAQLGAGPGAH